MACSQRRRDLGLVDKNLAVSNCRLCPRQGSCPTRLLTTLLTRVSECRQLAAPSQNQKGSAGVVVAAGWVVVVVVAVVVVVVCVCW